ncbi:MAG: DoxX family protein [Gammaproteobacteria bacterium]|nr:DoxX family protein [Gammaproteobacteria bacterium]NNC96432.1 DoxX family protein [Gammaproteobacteria bacterium]NNM13459.1 DoxX family protein [Gammaproteobacteria bacterium]
MKKFLSAISPYAHWPIRLSLAATFLYHGYGKFPVADFAAVMGMAAPLAWAVAISELVAGVALLAGAFTKDIITRLGAAIVVVIMIGAIFMVHLKNGFDVMNGGMEFQLLMLATGLYLLVKGNDV